MSLLDFTVPAGDDHRPETFSGVVADDATRPGQLVRVVIPEFDQELAHGPCPWSPVVTAQGVWFPKRGDRCVIVRPADGDPWITNWTPSAPVPDSPIAGGGAGSPNLDGGDAHGGAVAQTIDGGTA